MRVEIPARNVTATAESTGEAVGSPESDRGASGQGDASSGAPEGLWVRLVRFWTGR